MRLDFRLLVFCVGLVGIIATGGPAPIPPTGKLEYHNTFTATYDPVTREHTFVAAGKRCFYAPENGNYREHTFLFDDPRDVITVNLTDTLGVAPGFHYDFQFDLKSPVDNTTKAFWILSLDNPNGTDRKHDYSWTLQLQSSDPKTNIPSNMPLGGIYELGQTDRELSLDVKFDLYTNIDVATACSDYN